MKVLVELQEMKVYDPIRKYRKEMNHRESDNFLNEFEESQAQPDRGCPQQPNCSNARFPPPKPRLSPPEHRMRSHPQQQSRIDAYRWHRNGHLHSAAIGVEPESTGRYALTVLTKHDSQATAVAQALTNIHPDFRDVRSKLHAEILGTDRYGILVRLLRRTDDSHRTLVRYVFRIECEPAGQRPLQQALVRIMTETTGLVIFLGSVLIEVNALYADGQLWRACHQPKDGREELDIDQILEMNRCQQGII